MSSVQSWFRRLWNGNAGLVGGIAEVVLFPLELVYRGLVSVRNWAYDLGLLPTTQPPIPVISVGNLAVGGTGKTPFAAWLVTRLEEMGRRPALITRGYGADEVELHREWNPGSIVVVDPERLRGVTVAAERGADVAVLDDAFQHRAIGRDVDILLVAAEHGLRRTLLPRGRLREPVRSMARADVVVVTRKVTTAAAANHIAQQLTGKRAPARVWFEGEEWTDLEGTVVPAPEGQQLFAVTSVAEPDSFRDMVCAGTGCSVESWAFPDHHDFSEAEARRIAAAANGRAIVTTEKDAVKLRAFSKTLPATLVLRLRVVWESGLDEVMTLIAGVLEGV